RFLIAGRLALARGRNRQEEARQRFHLARREHDIGMGLRRQRRRGQHGLGAQGHRRLNPVVNAFGGGAQEGPQGGHRERLGSLRFANQRTRRFREHLLGFVHYSAGARFPPGHAAAPLAPRRSLKSTPVSGGRAMRTRRPSASQRSAASAALLWPMPLLSRSAAITTS